MEITKEKKTQEDNKWKILICVVTMTFMVCVDGSIVNVALPKIASDLNSSMIGVQWIVTSYLITISSLVLLCGRIGDIRGKCTVFKIGVLIFTIGSLCSGLSKALPLLIISRIIQGCGAACTMATSMGIITATFLNEGRGKAMGISASAVALGVMVGPAIGGILVSIRWDLIFWINIPIGIVAFIASNKILSKSKKVTNEKIDIRGTIVFSIFIVSSTIAITKGEFMGYTNKYILLGFLISIISLVLFIYLQKTIESPVLDLKLFKNKLFSLSILCSVLSFLSISCVTIILPFYLEQALNMSSFDAGMFLMIYPLALSISAPFSGSLSDKYNGKLISLIGLVLLTIGLFLMGTVHDGTPLIVVGAFNGIMGLGNGMFKSPNNSLVMSKIDKKSLGIAGSVNSLFRNLAMVYGFTLATTLLYDRMSYKLGYQVSNYVKGKLDVFIYGMDYVFIVAAIISTIGVVVALIRYLDIRN
ncbi:MFS transporter [Clostridium sp.]|uniref:MFS transporter n=1 Tax=Clostridium sp. TaxID=1506 RepID=UPI002FCAB136